MRTVPIQRNSLIGQVEEVTRNCPAGTAIQGENSHSWRFVGRFRAFAGLVVLSACAMLASLGSNSPVVCLDRSGYVAGTAGSSSQRADIIDDIIDIIITIVNPPGSKP